MERIILKIQDFYTLDIELNGMQDQTGLLQSDISMTTKYWLNELNKQVKTVKTSIDQIKNDLIIKYGEDDGNGNTIIPIYVEKKKKKEPNPVYLKFQNEYMELMNQDRELEYRPFDLNEFSKVSTELNFPILFQLIKVNE